MQNEGKKSQALCRRRERKVKYNVEGRKEGNRSQVLIDPKEGRREADIKLMTANASPDG